MTTPTAASLPRLLLVADGFASGRKEMDAPAIAARSRALVEAGVPFVMLRDHAASDASFAAAADALARDLRAANPGVRLVINSRPDIALALGAGLHVGRHGPLVSEAVALGTAFVGYSAHSATQVRTAALAGAAYATLSPVFETASHPDTPPLGLGPLRLASGAAGIPVFALGGLTPPRAREARAAGAHGVAVLSQLLFGWNAPRTARAFLDALGE
ncbi:MAG TPA: thiamine phosphate synthase [Rubricoccaceae bacterium]|jgi:thiamine-phosphate pyrophosphorylase